MSLSVGYFNVRLHLEGGGGCAIFFASHRYLGWDTAVLSFILNTATFYLSALMLELENDRLHLHLRGGGFNDCRVCGMGGPLSGHDCLTLLGSGLLVSLYSVQYVYIAKVWVKFWH
jgi:hypothetical protein